MTFLQYLVVLGLPLAALVFGYVMGKRQRERDAARVKAADKAAEDKAKADALRLKHERLQAQDDEFRPLWATYHDKIDAARKAFESACTSPAYIVFMKVDADYPGYGVRARRIDLISPHQEVEYGRDVEGRNRHYITNAPPSEPTFDVTYTETGRGLTFPTAQDAERWLEAALNPETVSWGFNAKGRPMGPVDRALLPAPILAIP